MSASRLPFQARFTGLELTARLRKAQYDAHIVYDLKTNQHAISVYDGSLYLHDPLKPCNSEATCHRMCDESLQNKQFESLRGYLTSLPRRPSPPFQEQTAYSYARSTPHNCMESQTKEKKNHVSISQMGISGNGNISGQVLCYIPFGTN